MGMLQDASLPPGAIVATHEDGDGLEQGQVRRNDGVVLNPACKNPWYVLATVAGEQTEAQTDSDLHLKNRRFWNGWICQNMSDDDRAALAEKLKLDVHELEPLSDNEKRSLNKRFAEAFPDVSVNDRLPDPSLHVDMSKTYFPSKLVLGKCHFAGPALFTTAHFAGAARFPTAYFAGPAKFRAVHFAGPANFGAAHFAGPTYFRNSHFAGPARFATAHFAELAFFQTAYFAKPTNFATAHFARDAFFLTAHFARRTNFEMAHFAGSADFQTVHFAGHADFTTAHFAEGANFSNGTFAAFTSFRGAKFKTQVPKFHQCQMHQDTLFSDRSSLWPRITSENSGTGKQAYTRLRQIAVEVHNPDREHFFLRQEMYCKEVRAGWFDRWIFKLYRVLADSGISVARPVLGLALIIGLPWGILGSWLRANGAAAPIVEGLGISIGNTLPFLGLVRKMHPEFYSQAPWWLDAISGVQSLAGIVLLFFLGLGLRNRFRLK